MAYNPSDARLVLAQSLLAIYRQSLLQQGSQRAPDRLGCPVGTRGSGQEALQVIQERRFGKEPLGIDRSEQLE